MQQDAHEFLNFLINHINESLVAEQNQSSGKENQKKAANGNIAGVEINPSLNSGGSQRTSNNGIPLSVNNSSSNISNSGSSSDGGGQGKTYTWINEIFQGILVSETRCLNCETVTSKDEDFFDLSIDVEQNTSITSCLRNFSNTETLCSDNKFKCDSCSTYQEAHVRKMNSNTRKLYIPIFSLIIRVKISSSSQFYFLETHEGKTVADDISIAFKKVQIHGTVQPTYQSFT